MLALLASATVAALVCAGTWAVYGRAPRTRHGSGTGGGPVRRRLPFDVEIVYNPRWSFPWEAYQLPRDTHRHPIGTAMTSWGLRRLLRQMAKRYAKAERMSARASRMGGTS